MGKVLTRWFKQDFFRWPKSAAPSIFHPGGECEGAPQAGGIELREKAFEAGNSERHKCKTTGRFQRFPRYNDVFKLLETRLGRCGEWANCYCSILRSVGFETRYIQDYTDHVWVEVFLCDSGNEAECYDGKWVHCDPCENAIDTPLVYEQGWGKTLSYVLAFARDHCLDVTRRYTKKGISVLSPGRAEFGDEQAFKNTMKQVCRFVEDEAMRSIPNPQAREERENLLSKRGIFGGYGGHIHHVGAVCRPKSLVKKSATPVKEEEEEEVVVDEKARIKEAFTAEFQRLIAAGENPSTAAATALKTVQNQ